MKIRPFTDHLVTFTLLAVSVLIASPENAHAQQIRLLKDINPAIGKEPVSNITFLGSWKGKAFFIGIDSVHGEEPYVTSGTLSSTKQLVEIRPGTNRMGAQPGFALPSGFIFQGMWKDNSYAIISTDGTEKGTFPVLRGPSTREQIKVLGNRAYVAGSTREDTLHVTDGSTIGTSLVTSIGSGNRIEKLWVANGKLWLDVLASSSGRELWTSDGTAKGTKFVYLFRVPYAGERIYAVFELNGKTYLHATDGTKSGLWITDGTSTGTQFIGDLPRNGFSQGDWISTGKLLLFAGKDSANGTELWVSDGSKAGTHILKDIYTGTSNSSPAFFRMLGSRVLFRAATAQTGYEFWITDGTAAGTHLIKDLDGTSSTSVRDATVLGNHAYFPGDDGVTGNELWITDGTNKGTRLVKDIEPGPGSSNCWTLIPTSAGMFFSAWTKAGGGEPWFSDGTTAGTRQVRNVYPAPAMGSSAQPLTSGPGLNFLAADDGTTGRELWITDGTTAGTKLLKDLNPGLSDSNPSGFERLGSKWIFQAYSVNIGREPWVTDGTSAGTFLLKDINPGAYPSQANWMTPYQGKMYFSASDSAHGMELWVTDGTIAGTHRVLDIFPKQVGSSPSEYFELKGKLYFTANDLLTGYVLFVTDGTAAGTKVADITPAGMSSIRYLGHIGDRALLSATTPSTGRELWISDGTKAGTRILKDIYGGVGSSSPGMITQLGNQFYFAAKTATLGSELWVTDGTTAGTRLAFDLLPGTGSSNPHFLLSFQDHLLFVASDVYLSYSLFISDGTLKGTVKLRDWEKGMRMAGFQTPQGSRLKFFALTLPATGTELWRTNGTPTGTWLVDDLTAGSTSGLPYPSDVRVVNGRYVFGGNEPRYGKELFYIDGLALSTDVGLPCGKDKPRLMATDAQLGKPMTFEGRSSPLGDIGLLCLGALPKRPLALGQGCELWFDLNGFLPLSAFVVTGSIWTLRVPVPVSPSLAGKTFASQVLYFSMNPQGQLQVSQGVMSMMHP